MKKRNSILIQQKDVFGELAKSNVLKLIGLGLSAIPLINSS